MVVRKSDIEGLGLFGTLGKDEYSDWELPVVDKYEGDRFFVFEKIYDLRQSCLQYMNHSDNPNIEYEEIDGKIRITALRDINNEELLIDYGWTKGELSKLLG